MEMRYSPSLSITFDIAYIARYIIELVNSISRDGPDVT